MADREQQRPPRSGRPPAPRGPRKRPQRHPQSDASRSSDIDAAHRQKDRPLRDPEPKPRPRSHHQSETDHDAKSDLESASHPKPGKSASRREAAPHRQSKHHRHESPLRDTASTASQDSPELPSPKTPPPVTKEPIHQAAEPPIVRDHERSPSPEPPAAKPHPPADLAPLTNPEERPVVKQKPSNIPLPRSEPSRPVPREVFKRKEEPSIDMGKKGAGASAKASDKTNNSPSITSQPKEDEGSPKMASPDTAPEKDAQKDKAAEPLDSEKANGRANGGISSNKEQESKPTEQPTTKETSEPTPAGDDAGYVHALVEHKDDDDESYPELDDMTMEEVHHEPQPRTDGGIRWAPFNVPSRRRAQTLVVLGHSLCIVLTVSLFLALCANPFAWPLLVIYLLHVLNDKSPTDGSLNYRWDRFRSSYIWDLFAAYFPAKLHKTHELPPTRKYIFGYHPHGIISHGAYAAFATDALNFSGLFPGITNTLLTLDSNFRVPFYRNYLLAMGIRSVSKESIVNILTKGGSNGEGMGRGVTIVVGGARESLQAQPGQLRLILQERKGFIRVAIRTGADLVPVLAFGENDLYQQLDAKDHPDVHRIQMFILKVWKFTLPFMHGRGIFNYDVGFMPHRSPLNVVVGAPIKVRQANTADPEEVDRLHGLYVAELEKVYDRYKDEFAPDRREELQILP